MTITAPPGPAAQGQLSYNPFSLRIYSTGLVGKMAKKKKVKRSARKSAKKTAPARSKKVSGRASSKATAKKTAKKPRASTSVDGILNRYRKERASQESQLAAVRKKIADLEAKTAAFQQQIAKLNDQETATLLQVEELDAKRDQEVSELLSKLGVRIGSDSPETPPSSQSSEASDNWGLADDSDR